MRKKMANQGEPHVDVEAAVVDNAPLRDLCHSTHTSSQSPVAHSDIKIEVDHAHSGVTPNNLELPRELTVDDVVTEKTVSQVTDSKAELAFIVGQGHVCTACKECFMSEDGHVYRKCGNLLEMQCTLCSFQTEFVDDMRSHTALKHEGWEDNLVSGRHPTCDLCGKTYNTATNEHLNKTKWKAYLKRHIADGHPVGADRPICIKCGKTFKNGFYLKRHSQLCGKSKFQMVKFKCFHCSHETKYKHCLERHIRRLHPVETKDRPICTGCGKSLKNNDTLECHKRLCEKSNNKIVKWKCFHCSHETKWKICLKNHIQRVHPIGKIDRPICTKCGNSFKNKFSLKKHLGGKCGKLDSEVNRKCELCNYETKWMLNLRNHIATQHSHGRSACTGCGKHYKNKYTLKVHMRICEKTNNERAKFECFYCSHKTKLKAQLIQHIQRVHSIEALKNATCTGCGKSYKNEHRLKEHIRFCDKSNDKIEKLKCKFCNYETKWTGSFKNHILLQHKIEEDRQVCPHCGGSFKHKYSLKIHMKRCGKFDSELVKFKCESCDFETKWKDSLKKHVAYQHSKGETDRHVCPQCGTLFKYQKGLKQHMLYCGKSDAEIVKHKCHICQFETKRKYTLTKHIAYQHSAQKTSRHLCSHCGSSYKYKVGLMDHMKYYCGKSGAQIVEHKCQFCNYKTKRKFTLRAHIRTQHSEGETYRQICSKCGRSYKNQESFRHHMKYCGKSDAELVKFKCTSCDYKTKRKVYLRNHVAARHPLDSQMAQDGDNPLKTIN